MRPASYDGIACSGGVPAPDDSGESTGQLHCDCSDVGLTGREVRHDPCDQHRPGEKMAAIVINLS